MKGVGRALGHGIVFYDGEDISHESLRGRHRFLDHLWLPAPVGELNAEQIFVINRHREACFDSDQQYSHARITRAILEAAISRAICANILEIGCGKFPLNVVASRYLGVDIDPEAIAYLSAVGRAACLPSELPVAAGSAIFDCVASAYAMHFSVEERFLIALDDCTTGNAIFCFNLIADDSLHALNIIARIARYWPILTLVKTPEMARREFFIVAGKINATTRVSLAARAMECIVKS